MAQDLKAGDFLIFQIESGYGLLRVLAVDEMPNDTVWHLIAYSDLFPDVDFADAALTNPTTLSIAHPHLALTNRAFESTQVAKMLNVPLTSDELIALNNWRNDPAGEVSDRSVRLLMGLR